MMWMLLGLAGLAPPDDETKERFRPATKGAVEGVLQLAAVNRGSGWVIAHQALGRVEARDKEAVAAVADGLKHPSPVARIIAARSLPRLDPTRLPDAVIALRR